MLDVGVKIFMKRSGKLVWSGEFLYNPDTHLVMPGENGIQDITALGLHGYYVVETNLNGVEKRDEFMATTKTPPATIVEALCGVLPRFIEQEEDFSPPPAD